MFLKAFAGEFDGVLTMYHDQGQIATKLKGFNRGVTVTGGLETVFTTPAHGTAFDIVGKGVATTGALEQAIRLVRGTGGGPAKLHRSTASAQRRAVISGKRRLRIQCLHRAAAAQNDALTDYVAGFVVATRANDIPADVVHLGKRSVIDGLGLALAGAASQTGAIARRYLASLGIASGRGSTVIGSDLRVPARFAAFANGVSIHADDYDDTQLAVAKDRVYGLLTHPTAPALPPALALAERDRRSGRDLMTAYQVGVEVECKVAEAILPRHYQQGFHSTATCGAIGAAAAAAKLLGPRSRNDAARAEPGRHAGRRLARELRHHDQAVSRRTRGRKRRRRGRAGGARASPRRPIGLEADRGFFRAAGGGYSAEMIDGKLGNPWTFAFPGVSIKPHPSGSLTHPGHGGDARPDPAPRPAIRRGSSASRSAPTTTCRMR